MFSSVTKKTAMAISSIALSGFIIAHAIGNATTFFGKDLFLAYAKHLHSLGLFIQLFEVFLLSFFLLHLYLAVVLTWGNYQARPQGYAVKKNAGGRTIGSKTMPYTGVIILLFLVIHLRDFHFMAPDNIPISDILRANLNNPSMAFFYFVALIALTIHISHGFWSLFQSLGLNHPKYNPFLNRGAKSVSLFTGTIFVLIPLFVQFCDSFLL